MARSGWPRDAKLWNSTSARFTEKDWASIRRFSQQRLQLERTQVGEQDIGRMLGQFFDTHDPGGHRDGADLVGASRAHVVRMAADPRYVAPFADPPFPPRLPDCEPHQSSAILGVFRERAESEVRPQAGMLHLFPRDVAQVPGDK